MGGQIPFSGKHAADINDQALERACVFLETTAKEHEDAAKEQEQEKNPMYRATSLAMASELRGKSRLLQGQASWIRGWKLNLK